MKKILTIILVLSLIISQNITVTAMDDFNMMFPEIYNETFPEMDMMDLPFMQSEDSFTFNNAFTEALSGAENASVSSFDMLQDAMNDLPVTSVDMPIENQDLFTTTVSETPLNHDDMDDKALEALDMAMDAMEMAEEHQQFEVVTEIYTPDTDPSDDFPPTTDDDSGKSPEGDDDSGNDGPPNSEKDDDEVETISFLSIPLDFLFSKVYATDDTVSQTATTSNQEQEVTVSNSDMTIKQETNTSNTNLTNETDTNTTVESNTDNTQTEQDKDETTTNKLSTTNKEKKYYIRVDNISYQIDTDDPYIKYMFSLIANKGITVSLIISTDTSTTLSVSYMSVIDELPDNIINKYNDFCIEELKKELPYGVFFLKDDYYYFTDVRTNEVAISKTDDPILQILIPLITDKGVKVCIRYENLSDGVIYINEVILTDDLPEDIAEEYIKQYNEYTKSILYYFEGLITIIDNIYAIQTDYGNFKLYSEHEQIIQAIINNCNTNSGVRVHGYLDPDTNVINVVQIDF